MRPQDLGIARSGQQSGEPVHAREHLVRNFPRFDLAGLKLEHYVLDFIPDCICRVQQDSGVEDITLIGYCMGGVLSTLYAALHPGGPLKNQVCFRTPIDWTKMSLAKQRHFKA